MDGYRTTLCGMSCYRQVSKFLTDVHGENGRVNRQLNLDAVGCEKCRLMYDLTYTLRAATPGKLTIGVVGDLGTMEDNVVFRDEIEAVIRRHGFRLNTAVRGTPFKSVESALPRSITGLRTITTLVDEIENPEDRDLSNPDNRETSFL